MLTAYRDVLGIWTIGWGNISMPDGSRVKEGDKLTQQEADELLSRDAGQKIGKIMTLVRKPLAPNQYAALLSFVYNLGIGAFSGSTLLKKINENPESHEIGAEFNKWIYGRAGGKLVTIDGLRKRREREWKLYSGVK